MPPACWPRLPTRAPGGWCGMSCTGLRRPRLGAARPRSAPLAGRADPVALRSFASQADAEQWLRGLGYHPVPPAAVPRGWGEGCWYFHPRTKAGASVWPMREGWDAGTWLPSDGPSRVLLRSVRDAGPAAGPAGVFVLQRQETPLAAPRWHLYRPAALGVDCLGDFASEDEAWRAAPAPARSQFSHPGRDFSLASRRCSGALCVCRRGWSCRGF